MTALIDADIVAYRAAYSSEGTTPEDAEEKTDVLLEYILDDTTFDGGPCELFLTGPTNFRHDIAKTAPYKGNRKATQRPEFLPQVRQYMVDHWDAVVSDGEEADDMIAIRATQLYPNCVIASVDKDFLQVPGTHYNTRTREFKEVDEWSGLVFFYQQILTGDRADNIVGIKGIGPKKSERMLEGLTTEKQLFDACVEAYGDPIRVIENGQLLWLRRKEGQLWRPPTK